MAREERPPGDEAALVERFRRGEEAALDDIMTRHRRPVYLMARRLLGNHEDADEAAQLTFVRAWRSRDRFRGDAALRTWLTRIVLNVAKSMRTGRARVESVELGQELFDGSSRNKLAEGKHHKGDADKRGDDQQQPFHEVVESFHTWHLLWSG